MPKTRTTRQRLPLQVLMFAWVSLLNEVSAQMVAPLIPVLLATVLAAGPVAIGLVEGAAEAVAAFVKLWSGRHADLHPQRRKALVVLGYGLALASRPLIGLAAHWTAVAGLRATDRFGKGIRNAPRDAILADTTPRDMQGRAYGLNRGMDYAGAVIGTLIAAASLAWGGLRIEQVIVMSALPGLAVLVLLTLLPAPETTGDAGVSLDMAPAPPQLLRWSRLPPGLRVLLTMVTLFTLARASEAFIVLRGHELGLTVVELLLLWAWLAALQSAAALVAAPWTDRVAKQRLVPWHWTSLALGYAALASVSSAAGLWIAITLYGLLSGISEGVERALVSEQAGLLAKGTAFGWYYLLTGLAALAAGLMFGGLWQWLGPSVAFGAAATIAMACATGFRSVANRIG